MNSNFNDLLYATALLKSGEEKRIPLILSETDGGIAASVPMDADWASILRIDIAPALGRACAGTPGYYVIPHGHGGDAIGDSILCRFRARENAEMICDSFVMPMWACIMPGLSFTAAVTSMTYEYRLVTRVCNGEYTCFARFELNGEPPYEPIEVTFLPLGENADYSEAALAYRRLRESRGEIRPYAERMKGFPAAQYTAESIYVRVRQGWKPVPSPVLEQTPETEPPMHVASTFEDVSELLDVFSRHGVEKAEFCLVGWNKSGHDGRWPQMFPVEEKLGGEEALRALTAKASRMGYSMVGHTNSTDAYSIADIWNETALMTDSEGHPIRNAQGWSGGNMYHVCPECGLRQAKELLPEMKKLGFRGTHYIDVITTVFPRECRHPEHPVTRRQCADLWNEILSFSRELYGGISSEGTFDFSAPVLDFGLYVSFGLKDCALADECVPLWQLVYHGYVLSNPYSTTVNPTEADLPRLLEYGGRPCFYYDSKFVTPEPGKSVNWMGENDLHCHTPEEREESALFIAKVEKWYRRISYLQLIPMKRHTVSPDGLRKVEYENGDVVVIDPVRQTATLNGTQILPIGEE